MADEDNGTLKNAVFAIMEDTPLESLTAKKVRRMIEVKQEQPKGFLDDKKDVITKFIDDFIKLKNESEDDAEVQAEEEKPARKKARVASGASGEPGPNGEAPKGLKDLQCNIMTGRQFEKGAEKLTVEVFSNILEGNARTFTSGNRGWYAGKKIQVKVGDKKVWAQVGLNITIIGSKEWKE